MENRAYKYCIVPMCRNTTIKTPEKLFFIVPKVAQIRQQWCKIMRRDDRKNPQLSEKTALYCCEDHFDLKQDMDNFWQHKLMGNVKLRLKKHVVPHIFDCQWRNEAYLVERAAASKRNGNLIEEASAGISTATTGVTSVVIMEDTSMPTIGDTSQRSMLSRPRFCANAGVQGPSPVVNLESKMEKAAEGVVTNPDGLVEPVMVKIENFDLPNFNNSMNNMAVSNLEELKSECKEEVEVDEIFKTEIVDNNFSAVMEDQQFKSEYFSDSDCSGNRDCKTSLNSDVYSQSESGDRSSLQEKTLSGHITSKHAGIQKNLFKCELCGYSSVNQANLSRHVNSKHGSTHDISFKCELCDYTSAWKYRLSSHIISRHRSTHKMRFKCELCDYSSVKKTNLFRHMSKHTSKEYFKCELCDRSSAIKSGLPSHISKHGSSQQKPFQCELCDYSSTRKANLASHIIRKHRCSEDKPFKCKLCDYSSIDKRSVYGHIMSKHMNSQERPYKCEVCNYTSVVKKCLSGLIISKHKSSQEKLFQCDLCDYSSVWKTSLNRHVISKHRSSEKKPFKCELCDYSSVRKTELTGHIISKHKSSQERPFKCELCDYGSVCRMSLYRHIISKHRSSEEKPFKS